jgi:hypothetical protein
MKVVTVIGIILLLSVNGLGQSRGSEKEFGSYKQKSEKTASTLSALATVTPIFAGLTIIALDHQRANNKSTSNGNYYSNKYKPDRTLPFVLIVSGVLVGPSAGYIYGGCPVRGIGGIAFRTGIAAVGALTVREIYKSSNIPWSNEGVVPMVLISVVGTSSVAISAIYDLAKVKDCVRERNETKAGSTLIIEPRYFAASNAAGIGVRFTF